MFRFSLVVLAGFLTSSAASAASWADALFDDLSKDFGTVARGPLLTHSFRVTNNTDKPVQIGGARVSCGCVSASILQSQLAPGQSTQVQAQMDTRRFHGAKQVTIYVQFTQPHFEEVRLSVQANSRDDLVVTPDSLRLGRVPRGGAGEAKVTLTLSGNGQTHVREVLTESNYIQATLKEVRRDAAEVVFELTAKLRADAPVGSWFTDVWVTTDNASLPKVRVPLTVEIESALTVSPAAVQLGQVKMGGEAERKVIVRGVKPFRITGIEGTDGQVQVKTASADSKPVHVLTVSVRPSRSGEQQWKLKIQTDLPGESSLELLAHAQVTAAE